MDSLLVPFGKEYCTPDSKGLIGSAQYVLSCNKFLWMGITATMSPKITGFMLYVDV